MLYIRLLHNNNIITIDTPGKQIIKSSAGLMFHNSAELLCAALGSCLGKNLVRYCSHNSINVELFESIGIDFINEKFYVEIKHPNNLSEENIKEIEYTIRNCSVAQLINAEIVIGFNVNTITPDITKRKPCCGG